MCKRRSRKSRCCCPAVADPVEPHGTLRSLDRVELRKAAQRGAGSGGAPRDSENKQTGGWYGGLFIVGGRIPVSSSTRKLGAGAHSRRSLVGPISAAARSSRSKRLRLQAFAEGRRLCRFADSRISGEVVLSETGSPGGWLRSEDCRWARMADAAKVKSLTAGRGEVEAGGCATRKAACVKPGADWPAPDFAGLCFSGEFELLEQTGVRLDAAPWRAKARTRWSAGWPAQKQLSGEWAAVGVVWQRVGEGKLRALVS